MAKQASEIKIGDQVQYVNLRTFETCMARVTAVEWMPGMPTMFISFDKINGAETFLPYQEVAFPRRMNGIRKVHESPADISVFDLMVGDIIPPEGGWPKLETDDAGMLYDLSVGYTIMQVLPYKSPTKGMVVGWRVIYKSRYVTAQQRLIPLESKQFYGEKAESFAFGLDPATGMAPPPKLARNTSGVYRNFKSDEEVTFRIRGKAGRPPARSIVAPPLGSHIWKDWEFVGPGDKHPYDVQYKDEAERFAAYAGTKQEEQ